MKTRTFGVSSSREHQALRGIYLDKIPLPNHRSQHALHSESQTDYSKHRENGDNQDSPSHPFPKDGETRWANEKAIEAYIDGAPQDGYFRVRYDEGPGDRAWMEEKDRNYLARLEREKFQSAQGQVTDGKQPESDSDSNAQPHTPATVPEDFLCPIGQDIMMEPVITADGHSYDRIHISQWLESHQSSPKTGAALDSNALIPNWQLKGTIDTWVKEHPQCSHQGFLAVFDHAPTLDAVKRAFFLNGSIDGQSNRTAPIHRAAAGGHEDILRFLKENGADFNKKDEHGCSALYYATSINTLKLLVELGASTYVQDNQGNTPLHVLVSEPREGEDVSPIIAWFLEQGADLAIRNKQNKQPLHVGAAAGHVSAVKALIVQGADIEAKVHEDYTPLHEAAKGGYVHVAQYLVQQGASTKTLTAQGKTAEQVARDGEHPEVADCIQKEKQTRKRLVAQIPELVAGFTEGPAFIAGLPALLEEMQQLRAAVETLTASGEQQAAQVHEQAAQVHEQATQIREQAGQIRRLEARLDQSTDQNHEAGEKQGSKLFAPRKR